jgi:hypothetical protein
MYDMHDIDRVWHKSYQWMTFRGTFSGINLDSSILDVILLTKIIFLAFKPEAPTLNIKIVICECTQLQRPV